MLIRFTIENFKSFRHSSTFTTATFHKNPHTEYEKINTFYDETTKTNYVKSSMIIGKNASGKSNLLKALVLYIQMILNKGSNNEILLHQCECFKLTDENQCKPVCFEAEFLVKPQTIYRYAFQIHNHKIHQESLEIKKKKWTRIYHRLSPDYTSIEVQEKLAGNLEQLKQLTKPNVLFLSVLSLLNIDFAKEIVEYFNREFTIITPNTNMTQNIEADTLTQIYKKTPVGYKTIELVKSSDVGIEDIIVEDQKNLNESSVFRINAITGLPEAGYNVKFVTKMVNQKQEVLSHFNLKQMSSGTIRLFNIAVHIFDRLEKGGTLIIDEIENNLHHILVNRILELFNSISDNPHQTQLIFTTHDLLLLDEHIRRDQIWIVDKNQNNESQIYNLAEMKGITKKDKVLKQYLLGNYGGVPSLL